MKLDTQYRTESNVTDEELEASVNIARVGLLIKQLAANYTRPELAVLREWVTNAVDSHISSSVKRPVEVHMPSALNRSLVIQDFGAGMSDADFRNIYMQFFTTTKDETNDEHGGYGIGSKSALAIADQYTVTSVHEGLKSVYLISRNSAGNIKLSTAMKEQPTDEPSGFTASVNVDRINQFSTESVSEVLGGWSHEEVKVIGEGSDYFSIPDNSLRTDNGFILERAFDAELKTGYRRYGRSIARVLVGDVLYTVDSYELDRDIFSYLEYFIPVLPVGSVTFPLSRENIEGTRANLAKISEAFRAMKLDAQNEMNRRVESIDTEREAFQTTRAPLFDLTGRGELKFKGEPIPEMLKVLHSYQIVGLGSSYWSRSNYTGFKLSTEGFNVDLRNPIRLTITLTADERADEKITQVRLRNFARTWLLVNSPDISTMAGAYVVVVTDDDNWGKAAAKDVIDYPTLKAFHEANRTSNPTKRSTVVERAMRAELSTASGVTTVEDWIDEDSDREEESLALNGFGDVRTLRTICSMLEIEEPTNWWIVTSRHVPDTVKKVLKNSRTLKEWVAEHKHLMEERLSYLRNLASEVYFPALNSLRLENLSVGDKARATLVALRTQSLAVMSARENLSYVMSIDEDKKLAVPDSESEMFALARTAYYGSAQDQETALYVEWCLERLAAEDEFVLRPEFAGELFDESDGLDDYQARYLAKKSDYVAAPTA